MSAIDIAVEAAANPWTHLDLLDDPEDFQFLLVADRTGGARPGVFLDGLRKAALLRPEFIMSVGDLIEGYTEDETELARQWDEFQGFFDNYELPFFYVPGNHDYTNPVMADIWRQRFGRSYYHFVYKDVLFLCLNSEDALIEPRSDTNENESRRHIGETQLEYFRAVLAENSDARWTLVFLHKPLWVYDETDTPGWRAFEDLLTGRDYTVFAGHFHTYTKHVRRDRRYIVLATTGGGSDLDGPDRGHFDHVTWVTMTDAGPVLANLMLEGIWDEDVFTTETARLLAQLRGIEISPGLRAPDGRPLSLASFHLVNEEESPLRVRVHAEPQAALPAGWTLVDSVPALSEALFPVPLSGGEMTAVLSFDVETSFAPEQHRPLSYEHHLNLVLGTVPAVAARPGELTVDGDLADWTGAEFRSLNWRPVDEETGQVPTPTAGEQAEFALCRDEEMLYLAIRVRDDDFINADAAAASWEHDYLTLRFDPRPFAGRQRIRYNYDREQSFYVVLTPKAEAGEPDIWRRNEFPETLQAGQAASEGVYTVELSLPLAHLRERGGREEDLTGFSLNVTLIDWNAATGDAATRSWQPDWHRDAALIGAGSFSLE